LIARGETSDGNDSPAATN